MKKRRFPSSGWGTVSLLFGMLILTGCGQAPAPMANDLVQTTESGTDRPTTTVTFHIGPRLTTSAGSGSPLPSPAILPAAGTAPQVTFQLVLVNYNNPQVPSTTLTRVVTAVASSGSGFLASTSFSGIPLTSVIGKVHIEGGRIGSFTDFHGARDLDADAAVNPITVVPPKTFLRSDVYASTLAGFLASTTAFGLMLQQPGILVNGKPQMVSAIATAASGLSWPRFGSSSNASDDADLSIVTVSTDPADLAFYDQVLSSMLATEDMGI